jgi:hypothetical protein
MGGTTAKASLIEHGRLATTEYEVGGGISMSSALAKGGGYALKLPVIDVSEVGAGRGVVRVDAGGALSGAESAGAVPGPACYAAGGTRPPSPMPTSCSATSTPWRWPAAPCRSTPACRARQSMPPCASTWAARWKRPHGASTAWPTRR